MVSTKFLTSAALFASTASASDVCNPVDLKKLVTGLSSLVGDVVTGVEGTLAGDEKLVGELVGGLKNVTGAIDVGCLLGEVGVIGGDVVGLVGNLLATIGKLL